MQAKPMNIHTKIEKDISPNEQRTEKEKNWRRQ